MILTKSSGVGLCKFTLGLIYLKGKHGRRVYYDKRGLDCAGELCYDLHSEAVGDTEQVPIHCNRRSIRDWNGRDG
jgi:hypothetical protein